MFGAALFLYAVSSPRTITSQLTSEEAWNYIESCLKYAGDDAVREVGLNGGDLYNAFPKAIIGKDNQRTYIYEEGAILLKDTSELEEDLNQRVKRDTMECIASLDKEHFEVIRDSAEIKTTIMDDSVRFDMFQHITIKDSSKSLSKSHFSSETKVRLGSVLASARAIAENIRRADFSSDLTLSSQVSPYVSIKPEFSLSFILTPVKLPDQTKVDYAIFSEDTTVWMIQDGNYEFQFAAKHIRRGI